MLITVAILPKQTMDCIEPDTGWVVTISKRSTIEKICKNELSMLFKCFQNVLLKKFTDIAKGVKNCGKWKCQKLGKTKKEKKISRRLVFRKTSLVTVKFTFLFLQKLNRKVTKNLYVEWLENNQALTPDANQHASRYNSNT